MIEETVQRERGSPRSACVLNHELRMHSLETMKGPMDPAFKRTVPKTSHSEAKWRKAIAYEASVSL